MSRKYEKRPSRESVCFSIVWAQVEHVAAVAGSGVMIASEWPSGGAYWSAIELTTSFLAQDVQSPIPSGRDPVGTGGKFPSRRPTTIASD